MRRSVPGFILSTQSHRCCSRTDGLDLSSPLPQCSAAIICDMRRPDTVFAHLSGAHCARLREHDWLIVAPSKDVGVGFGSKQLNVLLSVAIVARVTAQKVGQRPVGTLHQSPDIRYTDSCAGNRLYGAEILLPPGQPERRARITPHSCMVADNTVRACANKLLS